MPKRKSNSYARGGTCQTLSFSGIMTANDTTFTQQIVLPVSPEKTGSPQLIEIRSIKGAWINLDTRVAALTSSKVFVGLTTNKNGVTITPGGADNAAGPYFEADPQCFAFHQINIMNASTSGFPSVVESPTIDCCDSDGHGVDIATPNLYLTIFSESTGVKIGFRGKVEYCYTTGNLAKYLALVQSQISGN